MYGIVLLVVVALVSLLITRVATIALSVTGMARPMARFQARSALSGVGFTTSEAEGVVQHPVRRRIVMMLMLVGNIGLVTAMAGLLAGILRTEDAQGAVSRGAILIGGLAVVFALSRSEFADRILTRVIAKGLSRFTDLDLRDYDRLLHLSGDYSVKEVPVDTSEWLVDRTLGDLRLRDEGLLVLGVVRREGDYVGVPDKDTCLRSGDQLILYGSDSALDRLSGREGGKKGAAAHRRAVKGHRRRAEREGTQDPGPGRDATGASA